MNPQHLRPTEEAVGNGIPEGPIGGHHVRTISVQADFPAISLLELYLPLAVQGDDAGNRCDLHAFPKFHAAWDGCPHRKQQPRSDGGDAVPFRGIQSDEGSPGS